MFSLLLISIAELLLWPADIRLFAAFFIVGENMHVAQPLET
jgi:hypothetical protein